jgi:hypothetical protein
VLGSYAVEKEVVEKEVVEIGSIQLPCLVEAWAACEKCTRKDKNVDLTICVNSTPVAAQVHATFEDADLAVFGCNIRHLVGRVLPGIYTVIVDLKSPWVPITTESKEPDLLPFFSPLSDAIEKVCRSAKRASDQTKA